MEYRMDLMTAIVLTIILSLAVVGVTEDVRQRMQFTWNINEGDYYIFKVSVFGYSKQNSVNVPLPQRLLNRTRLLVTIVSLPEIPHFINGKLFSENIIECIKTRTTYENGDLIPYALYYETNSLSSRCLLPVGSWSFLDSLYPNDVKPQDNTTIESYIGIQLPDSFYIGYSSFGENQSSGWFGKISKDSGIPQNMTLWAWKFSDFYEYSYNVTLTLTT